MGTNSSDPDGARATNNAGGGGATPERNINNSEAAAVAVSDQGVPDNASPSSAANNSNNNMNEESEDDVAMTNEVLVPEEAPPHPILNRPASMADRARTTTQASFNSTGDQSGTGSAAASDNDTPGRFLTPRSDSTRGRAPVRDILDPHPTPTSTPNPVRCLNPASDVNGRLDTQVEVRVYPCNNSQSGGKKKFTSFTIKPEGVIIQGSNRNRNANSVDLGAEYSMHVGRKLQRFELSDNRACQLLVTTHQKSFWVVPAPEAFSRHSGTCRLLGDRKHQPAPHTLQVGDFLRVGSVGVVVIETHDGVENRVLSEEKIQKIMKDTTNSGGGFLDLAETDGENSDDSMDGRQHEPKPSATTGRPPVMEQGDHPVCYMCFDEEDTEDNPMITPCKCSGDTKYVHVECLRKWHTAEADNQICFLSSVDATCSVCKSSFKSDFKLRDGRHVKLFKSSLEPPYVSLLVATKHEMAQRLFNTRFQLSFSTLLKPDGQNSTRPLLLGRSSGSDMVLDYRTVSARHAAIRFKNGEFVFTDGGSSNGSYLYLRRPLELSPSQPVQFRLGRSMISMKVVNKWNRRLLRAVRRTGQSASNAQEEDDSLDDRSIGSCDGDVRITDGTTGMVTGTLHRRTRESVMESLPLPGQLLQHSSKHLDLLYALAYPKRSSKDSSLSRNAFSPKTVDTDEMKEEEEEENSAVARSGESSAPAEVVSVDAP